MTASTPTTILGGGSSGVSSGLNDPGTLQLDYQNLISGAQFFSGSGPKILNIGAGAIEAASPVQIGNTETAAEVASNQAILAEIAAYCTANGITVQVEADLTWYPTLSNGQNALVAQWAPTAASVGLPISSIEDVQEIATAQTPSTFASYAAIEANAVSTLIADYQSSSYKMTAANLSVGDMEGDVLTNDQAWWNAYDTAATGAGVAPFSYVTADTGWYGPWIGPLSVPSWQGYLEGLSNLAVTNDMALQVVVQGAETSTSADQFVAQTEQNAANLATLAASGAVDVSDIKIQSWDVLPVGIGLITSPNSAPNEEAEIDAVYPLYATNAITVQGSSLFSSPGQLIVGIGTNTSIDPLSIQWDASDAQSEARLAVVIIDQTGILTATQYGSGTVSNPESNILILDGDSADLDAELGSVVLNEPVAGPDTLDIESYKATGRVSDDQISVLGAPAGQSVGSMTSTSDLQGWLSASSILNTGTVSSASIMTSETFNWGTTGTAFLNTVAIHEPLAEYGVEDAPAALLGTAVNEVADVNDPQVDDGVFPSNGYANNPGVNNVTFAPLPGWLPASFNPAAIVMPLVVTTTTNTFSPTSGQLESSEDVLAPDPLTVVDATGTHPNAFATAFNNGGTQVTEYNTAGNAAWLWGSQFSTATLTYDSAGRLVEAFLQGGAGNPLFTIDDVFDPATGALWEEFQSTSPPPQVGAYYATTSDPYQAGYATGPLYVTEFNTGDNPNWDYVDWGSALSSDTEVWTAYFIMENFAGFATNFPGQYAGALNAYPYEFVNGATLDLQYIPGTTTVNLNMLSTITLDSQTIQSGLSGLNAVDAEGATGNVTISGLAAGGSTLIGGDNDSTIFGYGHDTIEAGAGQTTIMSMGGDSDITTAAGSSVNVTGDGQDEITLGVNSQLGLLEGSGYTVNTSSNTIETLSDTDFDVVLNSSNNSLFLGSGNLLGIIGSSGNIGFISGSTGLSIVATQGAQMVAGFDLANGDQIDLRQTLAGVALTPTLSNLSKYVSVTDSGSNTNLTISSPVGSDIVVLGGIGQFSLQNLIDANAFALPPH